MQVYKALGYVIQEKRKEKKISVRDLSAETRVPKSTISAIERGKGSALFHNIVTVALALGVSSAMIKDLIDENFKVPPVKKSRS